MKDYIGIPYKEHGRTEDGVDCWGLVCLYYKDRHNVELPSYTYDYDSETNAGLIKEGMSNWKESPTGDVILLRQFKHPSHVGFVEGDYFYHCEEGIGVVQVKLTDPRWSNRILGRYTYAPKCNVAISPSPLLNQRQLETVEPGITIREIVERFIDKNRIGFTHVSVEGQMVPPLLWNDTRVKAGAIITMTVVPSGGGKGLLRTILAIAVTVWSAGAGGAWMSGLLSVSAAQGAAIAGIVGMLAINALVPPPKVKMSDLSGTGQSNIYSISGAQNRFSKFGSIPVVMGQHRMVPPYIGQYTITEGDDQYLCCLFCLGYGPLTVTDLKIGDTALSAYPEVEYEIREGYATDTPVTIYPDTAAETALSVELTYAGGYQTRTTETNTDEGSVDISFPQGLVRYTSDGTTWKGVVVDILYRETGTAGAWINPMGSCILTVDILSAGTGGSHLAPIIVTGGGGTGLAGRVRVTGFPARIYKVEITSYGNGYTSAPTITVAGSTATFTANLTQGYVFRETSTDPVRRGFRFAFGSRSQWDIKIARVSEDSTSDQDRDATYWTAIRSFKNDAPVRTDLPYEIALVALRIKATGSLNGALESFSCLVTSKCNVWNGTAWVADTGTRNPGDLYRHLMQGPFNKKAVADARLDLPAIQAWSTFCTSKGFYFDAIFDSAETLAERIQSVMSVGRGSFSMVNNKFSVVIEQPKTTAVQMFGPKNIIQGTFGASRSFVEIPHALRCKFFNRDNDYLQEIVVVYADGYNEDGSGGLIAATIFQELDFFGVTDSDHAWKLGRFHLAQALWRQETFGFNVDYEHLVCTRGDLVKLRHDAPVLGISDGRILTASSSVITVDENCPMVTGSAYEVTVRKADGTFETVLLVTNNGDNYSLTATTSFTCAAGDYFHFGKSTLSDILCLVSKIEPAGDLSAHLTLVPYNAGVYTADSGAIPPYTSQATLPPDLIFPTAPTDLTANEYLYNESGILLQGVALQWRHSFNSIVDYYEVEMLSPTSTSGYKAMGTSVIPSFDIKNLAAGIYSFRVRLVRGFRRSPWLTLVDETLDAANEAPDDVTWLRLVYRDGVPWVTWYPVSEPEGVSYEVKVSKYADNLWGECVTVGTPSVTEWKPQTKGYFFVKATRPSGAESVNHVSVFVPFSSLSLTNVKETNTEENDWTGAITGSIFPCPPLVGEYDEEWNAAISGFDGDFDYYYDGSVKPDADGWTRDGTDYGSVSNGILTIAEGGTCNYYRNIGVLTGSEVITMSCKVRVASDGVAGIVIYNDGTGKKVSQVTITADSLIIGQGITDIKEFSMDFTSTARTIKVVLNESTQVYVDGELIAVFDELNIGSGSGSVLYFGRFGSAPDSGEQYWSEVDYAIDSYTQDITPDGWTAYGSIALSAIANSDYLNITVTGTGDHGYKKNPVMTAADILVLTVPFARLWMTSNEHYYLSLNNTASGYGIKIRMLDDVVYAESTDGGTAISNAAIPDVGATYTSEDICTLILHGDKFWFSMNRAIVLSGTAEADDAGMGDDIRWGIDATMSSPYLVVGRVFAALVNQAITIENGLCLMPGDTGTYTIENTIDLGYAAESIVDSDVTSTFIPKFDLLLSDDLLLESDLLVGGNLLLLGDYAKSEISIDSDTWSELVPGNYYGQDYNLRLSLAAPENEKLYLKGWTWEVDMPDRQDRQTAGTTTVADVTVTFSPAFQVAPDNIQVTIYNEQAGDHAVITNITTTGFDLSTYNSGSRVARVVFCLTQGY